MVPGAYHLIVVSPDDPDRAGVLGQMLPHVEVDILLHGPGHEARQAGWHPRYGQRQQVIKCGVQNLESIQLYFVDPSSDCDLTSPDISG